MSLEEENLLVAIADHPDDDGLRLAMADLIAPQNPLRAEFIRIQCALAATGSNDPRLREREEELLRDNAQKWADPLDGWVEGYIFRCGFLEAVTVDLQRLVDHADDIFGRTPIRELTLVYDGDDEEIPGLVAALVLSPYLQRVATLDLSQITLNEAGFSLLIASPHLRYLKSLLVSDEDCTVASAQALAQANQLSQLHTLAFLGYIGSTLGDAGVEILASAPHLVSVRELLLINDRVGPAGAQALARSPYFTGLTSLELGGGNYTLNRIGFEGVQALASSPNLSSLAFLDLDFNQIGDKGVEALAASPSMTNITSLRLQANMIGDAGVRALAASRTFSRLTLLDLSHNPVGDRGIEALTRSPLLAHLSVLWLYQTRITWRAVQALVNSPFAAHLQELSLVNTAVGHKGVEALLQSSYLTSITKLRLELVALNEREKLALRQRFGNRVSW